MKSVKFLLNGGLLRRTKSSYNGDLSDPEKTRLFNSIDLVQYFPTIPNVDKIQDIWKVFWDLFNYLKINCDSKELQSDLKSWVRMFLKIYQTKNVTPYIHSFVYHVPEFIEKYGCIGKFNQQGLEKLNDVTTVNFLKSTNRRKSEAYKQILQKWNRLEQLEDSGYKRSQRDYRCSICQELGHSRRACSRRMALIKFSS